ncbi:hypothetical protein C8F04DRAFT_1088597 [Mycena alexandri]|uniref:Uncharacterized protein n=1 Tax=Mycena alexandri TaxID=1745969 RepID=A0AAD6XB54_9AGAR|nr:hypothetical protein C8F04DRAFT_1088597 [Mycena alexandri]
MKVSFFRWWVKSAPSSSGSPIRRYRRSWRRCVRGRATRPPTGNLLLAVTGSVRLPSARAGVSSSGGRYKYSGQYFQGRRQIGIRAKYNAECAESLSSTRWNHRSSNWGALICEARLSTPDGSSSRGCSGSRPGILLLPAGNLVSLPSFKSA